MITENMELDSRRDAQQWASDFGLECDAQEERVADWIWRNKPEIGCTWGEFQMENLDVLESDQFWDIAGDCE